MSHIATVQIQIRDLDALERACARLGATLVRNERSYQTWTTSKPECAHVIRRDGSRYEIGVVSTDTDEAYALRWDSDDKALSSVAQALPQAYAAEVAIAEMQAQGFGIDERVLADGSIEILFTEQC